MKSAMHRRTSLATSVTIKGSQTGPLFLALFYFIFFHTCVFIKSQKRILIINKENFSLKRDMKDFILGPRCLLIIEACFF